MASTLRPRATLVMFVALGALACSQDPGEQKTVAATAGTGGVVSDVNGLPVSSGGVSTTGVAGSGGAGMPATPGGSGGLATNPVGNTAGSSGTGGLGGMPAAFPHLANVVIRLEATDQVVVEGTKVARWGDLSGNGNDAVQGDVNSRPTLGQAKNGQTAVHFSGKVDPASKGGDGGPYLRIADAPQLNFASDDWLIAVVAGYDNALDGTHNGALGTFFGKWGKPELFFCGNWPMTEATEKGSLHIGFGEALPGLESTRKDLNDGSARVYVARRVGGTFELRVNGVQSGMNPGLGTADLSSVGTSIGIGSLAADRGSRSLRGDLMSIVVVHGPTSDQSLGELETYLEARYAIAP